MPTAAKVRLFHLPFSFMLPQRVASREGYFEDEGLDVEVVERDRRDVDWKYIPADETLTGDYGVDLYPVCKWESIKRTWEMDDGRIVAKGTFADQPYAVFTRRDDIKTPDDLAGVPVGVNRRTGQEYTALKALEEHMAPEAVRLAHHGMPTDRLRALRNGDVDAVILLEPHSTLAEHLGFDRIMEFENHMGIVGADGLEGNVVDLFIRAYARAAADINANPRAYREQYLSMLEVDATVAPDLFEDVDLDALRADLDVPRYDIPEPADSVELDSHLTWMKRRELIDDDADIDAIVAPGGR
ncbi:ABC transporter substrate-binding protein [Halegenticoccus tardaugens]|uniref:ABC transporter substrate-binding protein n=1 Tax=Halegenticoccus tardaugens TaxID=2071624 RepID=UPI00100BEB6F|nr:ABC transporter substrate-binding protein [Halegenticoccus tardaugens]